MTKRDIELAKMQEDADWRWLLAAPQGRRILATLLGAAGANLMGGIMSENPLRTAYLEGRRSIGSEAYARLTQTCESADLPALLAEVMVPPDVRNRSPANRRDDDTRDDG